MKKIMIAVIAVLCICGGVIVLNNTMQGTVQTGAKEITLIVMDPEHDGKELTKEVIHTDAQYLNEVLAESNLEVKVEASEFGDYITSIKGFEQNESQGWVYESENNEMCKAAEFCPSISVNAVADQDVFVFELIKW